VGPLAGPGREPAQFGNVSAWGITASADLGGAQRFVGYMMSEGYLPWLALSPQGKYPVRFGDRTDPERYVNGWAGLQSGVERKAPLSRFYSERSIESIGAGARNFQRWGFEQDGAALVGALRGPQPIANALASAITEGGSAAQVARRAQAAVEEIDAALR
jgi:multiple sugar transport system substrate-binding protein